MIERFQLLLPLTDDPRPGTGRSGQFSRPPGVGLHSTNTFLMEGVKLQCGAHRGHDEIANVSDPQKIKVKRKISQQRPAVRVLTTVKEWSDQALSI